MESFQKSIQARTILPGLQEPTRQGCFCWGGSKPFPPAFEVFAHIRVFYLGRVEEVQGQLAWGPASVYLEMPSWGLPASH